ncbi:hypothetical protein Tco_1072901 [Tanacetum coccineum]
MENYPSKRMRDIREDEVKNGRRKDGWFEEKPFRENEIREKEGKRTSLGCGMKEERRIRKRGPPDSGLSEISQFKSLEALPLLASLP